MTTYYFDSINGSDSTGTGTLNNPWATYESKIGSVSGGDTLLFKRGTIQNIETQYRRIKSGLSASSPTIWDAYGVGANPIFTNNTNNWNYILSGAGESHIILRNLDFNMQGLYQTALYIAATGTTSCTNWTIENCTFYNAGVEGNGVSVLQESTATTARCSNITFKNCSFFNNARCGLIVSGATSIYVYNCIAYLNGTSNTQGGHGLSFAWIRTTVTSGWALVSGNIYKRTLSAAEQANTVTYVTLNLNTRLTKNTGTPTTPSLNEFGISGTDLYINIGSNPNTNSSIVYAWGRCGDNLIQNCVTYSNIVSLNSDYPEGHGIALDDYTEDTIIRKCKSFSNQGLGISNNGGDRNILESNYITDNGSGGIGVTRNALNVTIRQNTLQGNSKGNCRSVGNLGEINIAAGSNSTSVLQNVIIKKTNTPQYGIFFDASVTGCSATKNYILGYSSRVTTITETSPISGEAYLTPSGQFYSTSSVLYRSGSFIKVMGDVENNTFYNPPSIGAFEYKITRDES